METQIDQPPFVSKLPESPPFRIRTAHFFLLTTVCAAMATLRISWVRWQEVPADDVQFFKLQIGLAALLFGVAFTGVLILLRRRWRYGRSELRFPGHWLLLFMATGALIQGLVAILLEIYRFYSDSPLIEFYAWNLEKLLLCSIVGITSLAFAWLVPGNALILACVSDARRHLQQDWLHWTGVLVVAIAAVGEFGSAAYLLFWKS